MASSLPVGIQQLTELNEVEVRQQPSSLNGNSYKVFTTNEKLVFRAEENNSIFSVLCVGKERAFNMKIYDVQDQLTFVLRRRQGFCSEKMEMMTEGGPECVVLRQQPTFATPLLHIYDGNDKLVLRVKGVRSKLNFKLQTDNKQDIGSVVKKYRGFLSEMMKINSTYLVSFPGDLDVVYKAAVIASCVYIDYIYHER